VSVRWPSRTARDTPRADAVHRHCARGRDAIPTSRRTAGHLPHPYRPAAPRFRRTASVSYATSGGGSPCGQSRYFPLKSGRGRESMYAATSKASWAERTPAESCGIQCLMNVAAVRTRAIPAPML